MRRTLYSALFAVGMVASPMMAQQTASRRDTLRADYRSLDELLQKLPNISPPTIDEERALWLGALPLSCLDRLQARPGTRASATRPPASSRDTSPFRDTEPGDSTMRTRAPVASAAPNTGASYFWVATYSLVPDHDRLRAFWGCSDWHSAVASTWASVRLLERYPHGPLHDLAREKLNAHLGKSNLDGEISFFRAAAAAINPIPSANQTGLFERPYGFAWLLELQSALRAWPDSQAQRWSSNTAPLAAWMADSLGAYLVKLVEPVRAGAQTNTANSMTLALDYADAVQNASLRRAIVTTARRLYLADTVCATEAERVTPLVRGGRGGRGRNGDDRNRGVDTTAPNDLTAAAAGRGTAPNAPGTGPAILSPCLMEAALMSRVLDQHAYVAWLHRFLPPLESGRFAPLTEALTMPVSFVPPPGRGGAPPDTSAAGMALALANERARLSGLSFARAQAMERIAHALPPTDARVPVWHRLAAIQADRGFALMRDDTVGMSWLPAQALLYEMVRTR